MTPGARLAAAIAVLDRWLAGAPAEQALTNWARASRFAGSGDRAAVRDLVFDAIRCRRSFACLGGGLTGRGLILGGLRAAGQDPAALFTGSGHAPAPVTAAEAGAGAVPEGLDALDCPEAWAAALRASLGDGFAPVMALLRRRAPVFLRVHAGRIARADAIARLAAEGVQARPHRLAATALEVTAGARAVRATPSFAAGLVELQDAAAQAACEEVPLRPGERVLDLCAGGGGKILALAARAPIAAFAHDADPGRLRDLPVRAARAGAAVRLLAAGELDAAAPFDVVVADVPCSGSGAWRRSPEGKWRLQPADLERLCAQQAAILDRAAALTAAGGALAYITCSLFEAENGGRIAAFLAGRAGWREIRRRRLTPLDGGDGFFVSILARTR
jgi:16S rRNA (cytosine967-C5)-methyltransferase